MSEVRALYRPLAVSHEPDWDAMRRRRFSPRARLTMWWLYTFFCLALYFVLFATQGFLTAFVVTFLVVGALGLVVKWLSSL